MPRNHVLRRHPFHPGRRESTRYGTAISGTFTRSTYWSTPTRGRSREGRGSSPSYQAWVWCPGAGRVACCSELTGWENDAVGLSDDLVEAFRWTEGHADVWPWFSDRGLFSAIVEALADPFRHDEISKVVGIEARGFILAGAVGRELDAGVVPVRKPGAMLPGSFASAKTAPDYRGRTIDLLLQRGVLSPLDRVLLVDDWLETGSQILTAIELVTEAGASLVGVAVIVDDSGSPPDRRLPRFHALIRAESLGPN